MRIADATIYCIRIPLRLQVIHNLSQRTSSESLVVRLVSEEGVEGYGEGAPRDYVTGEATAKSLSALQELCREHLIGKELDSPPQALALLEGLRKTEVGETHPAALCAFETALLDLTGNSFGQSIPVMLGLGRERNAFYSAVIPLMPEEMTQHFLMRCFQLEIKSVKLKVKGAETVRSVALARELLGRDADLRVDANGAWTLSEAKEAMKLLADYDISSVEQPVPKKDFSSLQELALKSEIPIVADESVCTLKELREMLALDFPFILNLRLSKCGGLLNSLEIYREAAAKGVSCQLGCQVGETGILSALGRRLAGALPFIHIEGCFGNHLLKEDIVAENLTFGRKGRVASLKGPGLGATPIKVLLEKYTSDQIEVSQ